MEQWKKSLVREMDLKNLASTTKAAYLRDVKRLMVYYKDKNPKDIGLEEIKDYLHDFQKRPALGRSTCPSASTINRVCTAIKFYYAQVHRTNFGDMLPRQRVPKKAPLVLSQKEVQAMINSTHSVFYKAVLMTMYSTGMRQSELRNLKFCDVDSSRMVIYIKNAKGAKDRQASLSVTLLAVLRTYWRLFRVNNPNKSEYLFMPTRNRHSNNFNRPMQSTSISYIVKKAAEFAGVKKKFILTV